MPPNRVAHARVIVRDSGKAHIPGRCDTRPRVGRDMDHFPGISKDIERQTRYSEMSRPTDRKCFRVLQLPSQTPSEIEIYTKSKKTTYYSAISSGSPISTQLKSFLDFFFGLYVTQSLCHVSTPLSRTRTNTTMTHTFSFSYRTRPSRIRTGCLDPPRGHDSAS